MPVKLKWVHPEDGFGNAELVDEATNTFATLSREDGFVRVTHDGKAYVLKQVGKLHTVIEIALEGETDLLGTYKAGFGQSGTFTFRKDKQAYKWKSAGQRKWAWLYNDVALINFDISLKKADEVGQVNIASDHINTDKLILLLVGWYLGSLNAGFNTPSGLFDVHGPTRL